MEAPTKMARDKGVLYRYPDGTEIFVKGREHKSVTIQVKNVLKSHKTLEDRGGLHKDAFRSSLVEDASYLLGERNGLSGYLDYIAQNFDEDRAKGEELGAENYPEAFTVAGYVLTGGGGFGYRKNGDKNTIPLTNFTAKIVADTDLDGGPSTEPKREYTVEAWLGNKPLGKHRVDATRFDNMAWVPLKLGSQARVVPGYGNAAKAADAIKCYSDDTEITKVFTHTGYREVDGEMVYLHEGLESPEVRLSTALSSHYRLPTDPTPQEILEGIALSYELWNLAPEEVSIPITAAAYTAPLATTLNTDFVI